MALPPSPSRQVLLANQAENSGLSSLQVIFCWFDELSHLTEQ